MKNIQLRIVAIIKSLPLRQKKQTIISKRELRPKHKLEEMISNSKHVLVQDQSRYYCKTCSNSYHVNDKNFKEFINSACTDICVPSFSHNRPEPLHSHMLHVGNQFVHHSHNLQIYKGLVYCSKCGYRKGSNQVRRLAKPCFPPDSNGILNLRAIHKGELPPNVTHWPLEDSSDESSSGSLELF